MTYRTNVPTATIEAAAHEATGVVLTEGTIIRVNPQRYQALLNAGLLAEIDDGVGGHCFGVETYVDDMITCVIADCSAID